MKLSTCTSIPVYLSSLLETGRLPGSLSGPPARHPGAKATDWSPPKPSSSQLSHSLSARKPPKTRYERSNRTGTSGAALPFCRHTDIITYSYYYSLAFPYRSYILTTASSTSISSHHKIQPSYLQQQAQHAACHPRRPDRMRSLHQVHHRQHRQRQPRLHHRGPRRGARRRQGEHGAAPQAEARGPPQRESSSRGRVRLRVELHAIGCSTQYAFF